MTNFITRLKLIVAGYRALDAVERRRAWQLIVAPHPAAGTNIVMWLAILINIAISGMTIGVLLVRYTDPLIVFWGGSAITRILVYFGLIVQIRFLYRSIVVEPLHYGLLQRRDAMQHQLTLEMEQMMQIERDRQLHTITANLSAVAGHPVAPNPVSVAVAQLDIYDKTMTEVETANTELPNPIQHMLRKLDDL